MVLTDSSELQTAVDELSVALLIAEARRDVATYTNGHSSAPPPALRPDEDPKTNPQWHAVSSLAFSVAQRALVRHEALREAHADALPMAACWIAIKFHGTALAVDAAVASMIGLGAAVDAASAARIDFEVDRVLAAERAVLDALDYSVL